MKLERATILAMALALAAAPALAQQQTTQHQQSSTTTTTTNDSGAVVDQAVPVTGHQLKKDERADRSQANADKAEAKAAHSKKVRKANAKQDHADDAAAHASNPY
jgi:hypothetical protein